jgi:hypothetical protein
MTADSRTKHSISNACAGPARLSRWIDDGAWITRLLMGAGEMDF